MHSFLLEKNGEGRIGPKPDAEIEGVHIDKLKGRFKLATWSRLKRKKLDKDSVIHEKTSQRAIR
jgi:hypothetical protein